MRALVIASLALSSFALGFTVADHMDQRRIDALEQQLATTTRATVATSERVQMTHASRDRAEESYQGGKRFADDILYGLCRDQGNDPATCAKQKSK